MVAVSVTAQNTRIDAADANSSFTSIGGGAGAGGEPDIVYQGIQPSEDASRKVGTSAAGFAINTTITDVSTGSGTYQTMMMKYNMANFAALENLSVPGTELRIGSSGTAYAQYNVQGVDTYPAKGGFIIQAIDPNLDFYRTATPSAPTLTAMDYVAVVGDFTATSKGENVVLSAIDVGAGLTLTGGDGGDADGTWLDFFNDDEGDIRDGRYGYFTALEGITGFYSCFGKMVIGSSGAATEFTDSGVVTIFQDGFFETDWSGVSIDINNAGSIFDNTNHTYDSRGHVSQWQPEGGGFQDETFFDNSPTTEGTFSGGTGHAASDVITLDDGTTVTVDAVSSGVVTQFTISTQTVGGVRAGWILRQVSTTGSGSSFSITPDVDNVTSDTRATYEVVGTAGTHVENNPTFKSFANINLTSSSQFDGGLALECGRILNEGANTTGLQILSSSAPTNNSAVFWSSLTDPNGKLDNLIITKGSRSHHAIGFANTSPTTMTITNLSTTGFSASNDQTDSTLYIQRTTGTVTINISGGSGNFSYKSDGATVNIVQNPVTLLVNVKDTAGNNIEDARVVAGASSAAGDLPYQANCTITRSGTVATVTTFAAHNLVVNDYANIDGITNKTEDNQGVQLVLTVPTSTTFTYATTDSGATTYAGLISLTGLVLSGTTDASGNISRSRTYGVNQPVEGHARKSTASPYFKTGPFSGTVDNSSGATFNLQLVSDE